MSADVPGVPVEILPFLRQRPELSIFGTKATKPVIQPSPQPPFETSFQQHYQTHAMEHKSQKDYTCPICNKLYKSEHRLQIHMQTHEPTNVLPHVCIYCEKRFKTQGQLNTHMKTHFPENFNCSVCNKVFTSKANLRRHYASMHTNPNPNDNYQK